MFRILISVIVFASAAVSANAIVWKYGSLNVSKKTCSITGWSGNQPTSGKLSIPSTYKHDDGITYTVNKVRSNALDNLTDVTEITIPASIRYIGKVNSSGGLETTLYGLENFRNCPKLKLYKVNADNKYFTASADGLLMNKDQTVLYGVPALLTATDGSYALPDQIKCITDGAFQGNTTIKTLTISKEANEISSKAFYEMANLAKFKVSSSNRNYTVTDGMLISTAFNKIVAYPPARTTKTIKVTSGPVTVDEYAFANTQYAQTITLPETVTRIADGAFACSSITAVNLPESLTKMGQKVFFRSNLLTATIPSKCIIREADHVYTFASCPQLKSITIESKDARISEGFARDCPKLESVSFTHTPGEIRDAAFKNCPSLTSFPFSAATDMQGDSIFVNTGFENVVFDNANAVDYSTGNALFANCQKLKLIDMSAIGIDNESHYYEFSPRMISSCPLLTEIRLPRATSFSHNNSYANIGPYVPLEKMVIGNFYVDASNYDGIVHYYGGNLYKPETYVKTTDMESGSWVDGCWPLKSLYSAANGARVAPIFYCDAVTPAEDYVAKDATYYVPGRCLPYYSEAANQGCTVREMFSIRIERRPSPSGVRDALYLYLTSDNPSFKLLSYDIFDKNGVSTHTDATDNNVATNTSHDDIDWFMLVYTINGEEMKTRYTIAELENSAIGDIVDSENTLTLTLTGRTLSVSGNTNSVSFSIINANGEQMMEGNGTSIDLSALLPGLYVIQAGDGTKQLAEKFMLK